MAEVCVVLGSVREGRLGLRVARMILNNLQQLGARATLLDPLEINPPMLQQPLHFMKVRQLSPSQLANITHDTFLHDNNTPVFRTSPRRPSGWWRLTR